ncbi:hypothetical protein Sjap_009216 [Stephania japonica]|uniref:Reverse transcriptase Ty1/copia-type domain-containing protein n=1 Tax=Stephania japonica TaxID=461633 RepID=A0AAP0PC27_9MAGN
MVLLVKKFLQISRLVLSTLVLLMFVNSIKLCGLRQAPRACFVQLRSTLISWGFQNSKAGNSFFVFRDYSVVLYILVYFNDIIVTGSNTVIIQSFISRLHNTFALKDIDELSFFLGMEARRDKSGLYLTQSAYMSQLLKKGGMASAKLIDTHFFSRQALLCRWWPIFQ